MICISSEIADLHRVKHHHQPDRLLEGLPQAPQKRTKSTASLLLLAASCRPVARPFAASDKTSQLVRLLARVFVLLVAVACWMGQCRVGSLYGHLTALALSPHSHHLRAVHAATA